MTIYFIFKVKDFKVTIPSIFREDDIARKAQVVIVVWGCGGHPFLPKTFLVSIAFDYNSKIAYRADLV